MPPPAHDQTIFFVLDDFDDSAPNDAVKSRHGLGLHRELSPSTSSKSFGINHRAMRLDFVMVSHTRCGG